MGAAPSPPPPSEFAALPAEGHRPAAALALKLQQSELDARRATLSAQRGALGQRVAQSAQQGRGYGTQVTSAEEQLRFGRPASRRCGRWRKRASSRRRGCASWSGCAPN